MKEELNKLKNIIDISRIHFYKPKKIAEILYMYRSGKLSSLADREKIRKESKQWRNKITIDFINSKCSSSAKFQDDLFSNTAIPYDVLDVLAEFNNQQNGILEAYVYYRFIKKHEQLKNALQVSRNGKFNVEKFVDSFTQESGLKRSTDKIYEIIIYALFESLVSTLKVEHKVSLTNTNKELIKEFESFVDLVLGLNKSNNFQSIDSAHFFRAGITNAADRGIDLYANSGHVVQVKHVDLDSKILSSIGNSVSSNKIIIICKTYQKHTIHNVLSQLGFGDRIQSIITFEEVYEWYRIAFTGKYSDILSQKILSMIQDQILLEFPILDSDDFNSFYNERGYGNLNLENLDL
jgi:type II restriction enzyme